MTNYEWLGTFKPNQLILSRNENHAANYMTAGDWISDHGEDFADVPAEEIKQMVLTNTIWALQIYPDTPIGFHVWYGATLDGVVSRAREHYAASRSET